MTKRGVIKAFSLVTGITVIFVARCIAKKGKERALENIQSNRSEETKDIFDEYEMVCEEADKVTRKEDIFVESEYSTLNTMYQTAKKRADDILSKEKALAQKEYDAVSSRVNILETSKSAIETKEEKLVKDILKNDATYHGLKTAKKALKIAEKPTDKIEAEIEKYKNHIKENVTSTRTADDISTITELNRLKKELRDSDGRMNSIVENRTDEEKLIFEQMYARKKNLKTRNELRREIEAKRTAEEKDIFEEKLKIFEQIRDIEESEKQSIDSCKAFSNQLKAMGFGKVSVTVIGMLPVVPVCLFVGDYICWLAKVVKNM